MRKGEEKKKMRKRQYARAVVTLMACLLLVIFLMPQVSASESSRYDPTAAIVIHPPFKNFDTFRDSELPGFVREWKQRWSTTPDMSPREVMKKYFDFLNYRNFHGAYNYQCLFDDGVSFAVTIPEKNHRFEITFVEYRLRNGKIIHIEKDQEAEISPADFQKLKLLWANLICEAAEYHTNRIAKSHFREKLIAVVEKQLIDSGLLEKEGDLEKQITGKKIKIAGTDFSAEKLLFIPSESDLNFASFAPKRVIIIPSSKVYGLSFREAGIVMYHPYCLVETLMGVGDTVGHETFHTNKFFQGFLWSGEFDVETWTSLSERTKYPWFNFLFHPYQESIQHAAKIITSFDAQQAKNEMFLWKGRGAMAYDTNDALFDGYALKANEIAQKISKVILEDFPLAFYGNPIYWACVNDKFQDKNEATKAFLYSRFAFSLLGGPKETRKWLEENEHILLKAHEDVMEKSRKESVGEANLMTKINQLDDGAIFEIGRLLNLQTSSKEDLVRQIKFLVETGQISIPQIRIDPFMSLTPKTGEIGHAENIR
jgi:hypothetical protein